MTGGTFKARVGFGAEINMAAKAKIEVGVGKFLTASRGINSNIEGLDVNNLAAGLIALIGLTTLQGLIILTDLTVTSGRRVIVAAICFSYFFISF